MLGFLLGFSSHGEKSVPLANSSVNPLHHSKVNANTSDLQPTRCGRNLSELSLLFKRKDGPSDSYMSINEPGAGDEEEDELFGEDKSVGSTSDVHSLGSTSDVHSLGSRSDIQSIGSVSDLQSLGSIADVRPERASDVHCDSMFDVRPESMSDAQSLGSVSDVRPESMPDVPCESLIDLRSGSMSDVRPERMSDVHREGMPDVHREGMPNVHRDSMFDVRPESMSDAGRDDWQHPYDSARTIHFKGETGYTNGPQKKKAPPPKRPPHPPQRPASPPKRQAPSPKKHLIAVFKPNGVQRKSAGSKLHIVDITAKRNVNRSDFELLERATYYGTFTLKAEEVCEGYGNYNIYLNRNYKRLMNKFYRWFYRSARLRSLPDDLIDQYWAECEKQFLLDLEKTEMISRSYLNNLIKDRTEIWILKYEMCMLRCKKLYMRAFRDNKRKWKRILYQKIIRSA
ncbi:Plasmodium exported protein (PHIST), unknown function [Plasmodium vivax]|uniref:RAD protein (Pv-fam-e) n=3 Tax=Plasmodium vivax TaxID=5855 RepID=A5K5R8_PLAVS|nr:RAD protein (Pv-fam-e) [Plasmodium vivax]KMZ94502.1 RAD protein (Pv-fam-e) [Plasmodium vivax Mauritania I]EDL45253.1 RAD protein (Pv-fam-e) [Plasmodium vivax]CAI7718842.1 Plasmodium exported protein (PHIST), unknown function [Plasmodium vivax]SCO65889.1 RAD protein [Plasmodium vivax]VUZ94053.1 Plasmodium exported protein (PHIST), unknown function [Plasmodium vivax]|eukprot:XP_001614980.1 RAD protein (Pv-fam-e) [Plasmodium vivax Sal-1]